MSMLYLQFFSMQLLSHAIQVANWMALNQKDLQEFGDEIVVVIAATVIAIVVEWKW